MREIGGAVFVLGMVGALFWLAFEYALAFILWWVV